MFCISFTSTVKAENADLSTYDNVIYVTTTSVEAGSIATLSICMKNTAQIRGFQFNLYLPEGITAVKNAKGRIQASLSEARHDEGDEHTLSVSEQDDGSLLFLCGSLYDETFIGTEGEIGTLSISVAADTAPGDYPVLLKAMKLTETDISRFYETTELTSTLTITEKQQGVENEDEYTDISSLENAIYITKLFGLTGTTVDLNIKMKNSITVKGCSFKLKLPEDFELVTDDSGNVVYELSDCAKPMSVSVSHGEDNSYYFLLPTLSDIYTGMDDTFITLKMIIPNDADGYYKLYLTEALFTSEGMDNYPLENVITSLYVSMYPLGDVNHSGTVTPADALMIQYDSFGVTQKGFYRQEADIIDDGDITSDDTKEALFIYFREKRSKVTKNITKQ